MTGFGKVTAELPDKKVTVEIKSLNSKQLDLSVRIPAVYREREMQLRNELLQRLERGKVDLNINVEYLRADQRGGRHGLLRADSRAGRSPRRARAYGLVRYAAPAARDGAQ